MMLVRIEICKQQNLVLPEDLREEEEYEEEESEEIEEEPLEEVNIYVDDFVDEKPKKLGFFGTLAAILGASQGIDNMNRPQRHNGRCNGDCANCHHITDIVTADGITVMTMFMVVSLVVIKAVAAWINGGCYVWKKKERTGTDI